MTSSKNYSLELEEVPNNVMALLDFKLKLQKEEMVLEMKQQEGTRTKPEAHRMVQVRQLISETNTSLAKLGYRKTNQIPDDTLGCLLRMKDIVSENFGIQKRDQFAENAIQRHKEQSAIPFLFLNESEHEAIQKYAATLNQLRDATEGIRNIKGYLEDRIKETNDAHDRRLYTEIFKLI